MIAAIVPAAGLSTRMGRPKLTLPIDGVPVIGRVVDALRAGGAQIVVVVAPPAEVAGAGLLADEARHAGADVLVADQPPPDMRGSVELGLTRINAGPHPETVLLIPGDSPGVSRDLVARVIREAQTHPDALVIPTAGGRRGHPLALPWPLTREIFALPHDRGVNALVARYAQRVIELEVADARALADLDTPDDYRRWSGAGPA
jgi:molybdenum cofactor cytidylyltransferase